jgi:hypothetical protein
LSDAFCSFEPVSTSLENAALTSRTCRRCRPIVLGDQNHLKISLDCGRAEIYVGSNSEHVEAWLRCLPKLLINGDLS